MTYHMERTMMRVRGRGRGSSRGRGITNMEYSSAFDYARKIKFPEKLYEVVSSGSDLIRWTDDGNGIIVNAENFEFDVMDKHPGLVQIPTFANFRRQLRWYSFSWISIGHGNFLFTHKNFVEYRKDLLDTIFNKKQSFYPASNHLRGRYPKSFDSEPVEKPCKVSTRGSYKPRGKRGRPRKRREASPTTPKQATVSPSDEDLHLDEDQLDQVAAVLEQSSSQNTPQTSHNSTYGTYNTHGSYKHSQRHHCNQPDAVHHCCHCCCHCCCCHGDDSWWNYCKPWMPQDGENESNSTYPSLSYYNEFAPTSANPVTFHETAELKPSPMKLAQLGNSQMIYNENSFPVGEPVEFILCTPTQLHQPETTQSTEDFSMDIEQFVDDDSETAQNRTFPITEDKSVACSESEIEINACTSIQK